MPMLSELSKIYFSIHQKHKRNNTNAKDILEESWIFEQIVPRLQRSGVLKANVLLFRSFIAKTGLNRCKQMPLRGQKCIETLDIEEHIPSRY